MNDHLEQNPAYGSTKKVKMKMNQTRFIALSLTFFSLVGFCAVSQADATQEKKTVSKGKNLIAELYGKSGEDDRFIVETDEETATESLNRISGKYDLGRSAPSQSYKMDDQYHAGAFGRKEPSS